MSVESSERPKRVRAPGRGTPSLEVARRQLPEVIEWLQKNYRIGDEVSSLAFKLYAPGQSGRSLSTKTSMGTSFTKLLVGRKILYRKGKGRYLVQFAI